VAEKLMAKEEMAEKLKMANVAAIQY